MAAGAYSVQRVDEFDHPVCVLYGGVRAIIFRAVFDIASGQEDPWKRFVGDADPGIGLVILQQNVVMRLKLLDQIVFQKKGILLRFHQGVVHICDMLHQGAGFLVKLLFRTEILAYATFQILGFADIYDCAGGIEVSVHPGSIGQLMYFLFKIHYLLKNDNFAEE